MEDAIMASVLHLGIEHKTRPKIISRNDEGQPVFSWEEISKTEISPKLMYVEKDGNLKLVWNFYLDMVQNADYWSMNMDAQKGTFLKKDNLTVYCQHHDHSFAHQNSCKIKTFRKIEKNQVSVDAALNGSAPARYNAYAPVSYTHLTLPTSDLV